MRVMMKFGGIGDMMLCFAHGEKWRISGDLRDLVPIFKALDAEKS